MCYLLWSIQINTYLRRGSHGLGHLHRAGLLRAPELRGGGGGTEMPGTGCREGKCAPEGPARESRGHGSPSTQQPGEPPGHDTGQHCAPEVHREWGSTPCLTRGPLGDPCRATLETGINHEPGRQFAFEVIGMWTYDRNVCDSPNTNGHWRKTAGARNWAAPGHPGLDMLSNLLAGHEGEACAARVGIG